MGQLQERWFPVYFWQQSALPNGSLISKKDTIQVRCHRFGKTDQPARTGLNNYTTGRIAGGGSAINGEQFVTGSKGFWDTWAKTVGDDKWSARNVKKAFDSIRKQLAIRQDPGSTADTHVSKSIIRVWNKQMSQSRKLNVLENYNDLNSPENGGVDQWQYFQNPDGSRADAYNAFIVPIKDNKNYTEYLNTTALRLLFDDDEQRCTSVVVVSNGRETILEASKEIILCCGIYTCALLQRSGIGPRKELKCNGIKLIVENPHVGLHSRNHLIMRMFFNTKEMPLSVKKYKNLYTGGSFLPILSRAECPEIRGYQLFGVILSRTEFLLLVIHLQPHSEGQIKIANSDPLSPLLPDNNYFGDPQDLHSWLLLWEKILIPLSQKLSPWKLTSPLPSVMFGPEKVRKEWLLENLDQTHHWSGSNRMACSGKEGVVAPDGKVFGVESLRVADVSVAPLPPDGNPCGPAYAVGEIIAQSLVKDHTVCTCHDKHS